MVEHENISYCRGEGWVPMTNNCNIQTKKHFLLLKEKYHKVKISCKLNLEIAKHANQTKKVATKPARQNSIFLLHFTML